MPLTLTEQEKALEQAKQESGKTGVDSTYSTEDIDNVYKVLRQRKHGAASIISPTSQPTVPTPTPRAATAARRTLTFGS